MSNQRVIKFRAWDSKQSVYITSKTKSDDGQGLTLDGKFSFCSQSYFGYSEDDRYILEQFTGLLDKNCKEIYEGDIVKIGELRVDLGDSFPGKYITYPERVMVVSWIDAANGYGLGYVSHKDQGMEIISNIHENTEFLNPS